MTKEEILQKFERIGPVLTEEDAIWIPKNKTKQFLSESISQTEKETRGNTIKEIIDDLESNPNPDGSMSPNIPHWIEQKQIQLRGKVQSLLKDKIA